MKGLKTAGPAIRCLGQGRKGEAGGGGGGRHREVEAVRWRMDHRCTEGRGRGSGRGALENEARNEKRREVEMVMGGIRKRGGKKNCGGCCEKVGLKSFEGNGIINGCRTRCEERGGIERKQLDFKITGRCFGKVLEGRSRNGMESMGLEMEDLLKK